jgi:hypothetical protein
MTDTEFDIACKEREAEERQSCIEHLEQLTDLISDPSASTAFERGKKKIEEEIQADDLCDIEGCLMTIIDLLEEE